MKVFSVLLFILFQAIHSEEIKFTTTKREYWPKDNWKTKSPESVGMKSSELNKAIEYAFTRTGDEKDRVGLRTDSVIIIKNGFIVSEKYARGYTEKMPHLSWSVGKAFASTLVGIAEKDGLLKKEDFAYKYFPALDDEDKKNITIENILNMSSGLDWNEGYESSPLNSSVIQMLYTLGKKDMASYTASRQLKYKPGTYLYYSSGDTNLLMGILKNILKEKNNSYPKEKLFDKIGMKNVFFEKDSSGTFIGSSYIYATPRDYAKYAFLYLNGGVWNGERILSEEWMRFTTTISPSYSLTPIYYDFKNYAMSAQWYLNTGDAKRDIPPIWPNAPKDTFATSGHWGQKIWVIPSLDLAILIFADHRDGTFDENKFLDLILGSLK